ncbi:Ig-like domain-containing protein [candidate division KSB1 bacterium]|nr:Ig-like domain-containing protein [candidate division KSB1 bacterium]
MSKGFLTLKYALRLLGVVIISLVVTNCTTPTDGSINPAIIKGVVVDQKTLIPLAGALVQALPYAESALTEEDGAFTLSIQLSDSTSKIVTIVVSKTGFVRDTLPAHAIQANKTLTLPEVRMTRESGNNSGGTSGPATNIVLVEVETNKIFVAGSGGNATSDLTFEVRDATGAPVDLTHQETVSFRIAGGPGGGEAVSPASTSTNALGRVITTVQSGTIAGPIQVVASIQSLSLFSAPVPLSIHGGLPHLQHFSVVPRQLNFPGYNIYGLENLITAFVGDRYSNPVPPGTSVQFQTTGGIIGGSAVTEALGRAPVVLLSAAPQPQGIPGAASPFNEPGFARITAETVDENKQTITANTVVLFSGRTQISVTPRAFTLKPDSSRTFNYTVSDQNNNPLVAGTSITVSSSMGEVTGDKGITLEDTQSRAFTNFSFTLTNSKPDSLKRKIATVVIQVNSLNGNGNVSFQGTMLPRVP